VPQPSWPFDLVPGGRPRDVLCLGHALVDRLAYVDDEAVEEARLEHGVMVLVDAERAAEIERSFTGWLQDAGGSAANTAAGIASLGGRPAFVGAVGRDEAGSWYAGDLGSVGVECTVQAVSSGLPTGVCHVLVTPAGERSMATSLGASSSVDPSAVEAAGVDRADVLYVEGYLLDAEAVRAVERAIEIARDSGTLIALSLSDPFVVSRHRDRIAELVFGGTVDLLFGNEEEIFGLTATAALEDAVTALQAPGRVAIVTRGAKGSVAVLPDDVVDVPAVEVDDVADTTGAGDLFAAGCLFALTTGRDPATALRVGSFASGEVIGHIGARPAVLLRQAAPAELVGI
jgi:sugar/nucleoside kinase (ribokinase family)